MRTVLILLSAAILVAFVDAQQKSNFTKPVINLDKRPRPVWNRPPEERRKLSIFPKTSMKFIVTPKTVVKNDEEAKGLPIKRPLMRKFVMQDKSGKGTWSFAPREPLMKSKRFTVTLAPPRIDNFKTIDEMKPDESKKVKTVVDSPIPDRELSKTHNLNKGNLIEMVQIKKVNPAESKGSEKMEQKFVEEKVPELTNENNTNDLEVNDNKTLQISDKHSDDYVIDVRNSNDVNETKYEEENEYDSSNTGQLTVTPITPDIEVVSKESRVLDMNDIELPNDQYDNYSLIVGNQENNNDTTEQIQSFSELDTLLKSNVNDTEEFNLESNFNSNNSLSSTKNETNVAVEYIPLFNVSQPNKFHDVTSLSNDDEKENVKEEGSVVTSIQDTQNVFNAADSGIVSNLEDLMQLFEKEARDMKTDEIYLDNTEARQQIESYIGNRSDIDTVETYTDDPATNSPIKSDVTDNFMRNDLEEISGESEVSGELNPVFIDLNSEESFENKSLSSTEISNESLDNDDSNKTSNEPNGYFNLTAEEIDIESNNTIDEDVSNESIRDASNNYTEELSNEFLINKSNNLTGEEISNESSSNMASEELSNESIVDKSNNLTEETSNESLNETSNFTGEEISHESDIVLSNESIVDKSNNLTEETSNESLNETSNNFTGEEISHESDVVLSNESIVDQSNNLTEETSNESLNETSNFTGEEISHESDVVLSNESIVDQSNNLTKETSNESLNETSNNFTDEEISDEFDIVRDEWLSNDSRSQDMSREEISDEALANRFKRSNNIIEEENSATTVSGFKYKGQETRLTHDLSYKNINA